jgi:hypothetical protein
MGGSGWAENFDFYEGSSGEDRAIVTLDLAAGGHAPVATHPLRLQFRVEMRHPRPDGLRSATEAPELFALEDRLVDTVRTRVEGIYVGRVVAQGFTAFYFYVPAAQREQAQLAGELVGDVTPYELEWMVEDDAGWERYGALFPNRYALQTILNRRLVAQMVKSGDQLEMPREIDHAAHFPSRLQAEAASEALGAAGYRVEPLVEGKRWFLEFHRQERCDGEEPDRFVFAVLDLLEPHEGEYDGWGSAVQLKAMQ